MKISGSALSYLTAGGVIIALALVFLGLRFFFYWRIKKDKEKYYQKNKKICMEAERYGRELTRKHERYNEYVLSYGLNQKKKCSRSVVNRAKNDPVGCIFSYTNIEKQPEDYNRLNLMVTFLEGVSGYNQSMLVTGRAIKKTLPFIYKPFVGARRVAYIVTGIDYSLTKVKPPYLLFDYTSPAGKASDTWTITISVGLMRKLEQEIAKRISGKNRAKYERSLISSDLREAIKKRDNYTCQKCGNSVYKEANLLLEVDHIIPISKGGRSEASNLQTLCWRCNREKGNKI